MVTVKIGSNELVLYSDSKDMPHYLYITFLKMVMLDAGIGSSITDVMEHLKKLYQYAASNMPSELKLEAENLHYNFNTILTGINFQALSFACRVYSINGDKITDYSDDGLKEISTKIGEMGMTQNQMESLAEELKKKVSDELKLYYPTFFPEDDTFQFYQRLKQKILLSGELFNENNEELPSDIQAQLDIINGYFMNLKRPRNFRPDDPENEVVSLEKSSAGLYAMLEANGMQNVKILPIFDFYARLEYMKKSTEQLKNKGQVNPHF